MKKKKLKRIFRLVGLLTISLIMMFNIYALINQPLVYLGGCNDDEYELIQYIGDNYNETSNFFSDLRISSVIRKFTNVTAIDTFGSQSVTSELMNITYSIFYSEKIEEIYDAFRNLLPYFKFFNNDSNSIILYMSKVFVNEGITTMDYTFGPISQDTFNLFKQSIFFVIVYENPTCYLAEINFD